MAQDPQKEPLLSEAQMFLKQLEEEDLKRIALVESLKGIFPDPVTNTKEDLYAEIDGLTRKVTYVYKPFETYAPTDGDFEIWGSFIEEAIVKCYNMETKLWDKELLQYQRLQALEDAVILLYRIGKIREIQTYAREKSPLFEGMYTILADIQPPENGEWYTIREYHYFPGEYLHKFKIYKLCGRSKKTV